MGIQVEFNPDLALRDYSEFEKGNRKEEECIPRILEKDKTYNFLKKDHRNFWLMGELALLITKGEGNLSRPIASIKIIEATHFLIDNKPYTKGLYKIIDIFDINNPKINFEWMERVK
ncbi:hypothetical protein KY306_02465 [Candidatus Woesearchaeota archaeon]|nr:hypothetical protein [Candidatus Woesearchaeota archaeon]